MTDIISLYLASTVQADNESSSRSNKIKVDKVATVSLVLTKPLCFSGVPPSITGAALNKLNIAKLCNSNITTSQLEAILRYAYYEQLVLVK